MAIYVSGTCSFPMPPAAQQCIQNIIVLSMCRLFVRRKCTTVTQEQSVVPHLRNHHTSYLIAVILYSARVSMCIINITMKKVLQKQTYFL